MPQLTALEVVRFVNLMNGLPSYFVEAMLLAPQLTAIHVSGHCRWPRTYWQSLEESPVIPSHMKEFTWMLKVPLESMRYQELLTSSWPCLSELSLIGQSPPAHSTANVDFAPLFFNIPSLQIFTILVPQCAYLSRITLLLPSATNSYPALDSLRSLKISFPDPKDIIFDRLPESLHHLSLTDWPRHYLHVDEGAIVRSLHWTSPILTSSELHDILRRCRCSALESLEVVYKEDNSDGDVLLHMAHVFPALRTLKIFRYRWSSHDLVDIKAIRRSLSHLTELRTLFIHIDMDGASMPAQWEERKARIRGMEYRASLGDLAQALVEGLAPSLEQIYMLERWPMGGTSNWKPWEVIREIDEGEVRTICRKVDGRNLREQSDK
ncbi:uncharacterized protein STEHIDRAFT_169678 [Stereum hirsutum FP-91666 SS1]|uniref:uncharacterized protein n=1 Tax=Stereum hirsutum (strain FP-91666) TaxID=721885 RepID=UPI0004449905|nr:uncharacterized protein STEHIDRAFT_169678 [Stereum hirsutum FP-91666 SS1]EIM84779.1 hypothetical protein STEHIDRAFT_169678 [Stereum hirsutum FP-91666 SS1]